MKKPIHKLISMLLIAVLLAGCQQKPTVIHEETLPDNLKVIQVDGPPAYGIDTEGKLDRDGLYYPYTGGEMTLDLFVRMDGMWEVGIMVLLFLDGQPQPYRLEGSEKTAYMQAIHPKSQIDNLFGISFIPVTGSVGDALELCILYLPAYGHRNSNGSYPWYERSNATFYMTRLKLEEDPPEPVLPPINDRVLSLTSHHTNEKKYGDVSQHIGSDAEWALFFNWLDVDGNVIDDLGEEDRMRIYFELSGDPAEEYVFILYVDDEPVLLDGEALTFRVDQDQTLWAEIDVDCTGFEYMMFAMVLEKNFSGDGIGWESYPTEENMRVFRMLVSIKWRDSFPPDGKYVTKFG